MANVLVTGGAGYIGSHTCVDGFVGRVEQQLSQHSNSCSIAL